MNRRGPGQDSVQIRTFTSSSPEETIGIGRSIAGILKKGSILALRGSLGAGKTCLVKGIASFFGIDEEITSPTYTIVSEYEGTMNGKSLPFYHIDAYRLKGEDDFTAMGGEEYLYGGGITVVEWSDRINEILPADAVTVDLEISGPNSRIIRIGAKKESGGYNLEHIGH